MSPVISRQACTYVTVRRKRAGDISRERDGERKRERQFLARDVLSQRVSRDHGKRKRHEIDKLYTRIKQPSVKKFNCAQRHLGIVARISTFLSFFLSCHPTPEKREKEKRGKRGSREAGGNDRARKRLAVMIYFTRSRMWSRSSRVSQGCGGREKVRCVNRVDLRSLSARSLVYSLARSTSSSSRSSEFARAGEHRTRKLILPKSADQCARPHRRANNAVIREGSGLSTRRKTGREFSVPRRSTVRTLNFYCDPFSIASCSRL